MTGDLPLCRRSGDLAVLSGRRARVRGEYAEVDLRKYGPTPPLFEGRAGLRLEDGALVLLEPSWSQAGVRPEAERRALAGRAVEAIGLLHNEPVKPPEPLAFVHYPCLSPVESVAPTDQAGDSGHGDIMR